MLHCILSDHGEPAAGRTNIVATDKKSRDFILLIQFTHATATTGMGHLTYIAAQQKNAAY